MPLNAYDREGVMGDCFNTVILWTMLHGAKSIAQFFDRLVMSTVYQYFPAIQGIQPGISADDSGVIFIPMVVGMPIGHGQLHILYQCTAKAYIDELHSFTDT